MCLALTLHHLPLGKPCPENPSRGRYNTCSSRTISTLSPSRPLVLIQTGSKWLLERWLWPSYRREAHGRMSQPLLDFQQPPGRGRRAGKQKQTEILERQSPSLADPRTLPAQRGRAIDLAGGCGDAVRAASLARKAQMSVMAEIRGCSGSLSHRGPTVFGSRETSKQCSPEARPGFLPACGPWEAAFPVGV